MFIRTLFLLFALILPSIGVADDRRSQIEVNVTQANVHGLILRVADASQQNLAIGGYADQRLTLSATYPSYQDFLEGTTKAIGGNLTTYSSTPIITSNCIGAKATPASDSSKAAHNLGSTKISLNFAQIDPAHIFNTIYAIDKRELSVPERFKPGNYGLVGLWLKDTTLNDIHQILSRASGVEVINNGLGNLEVKRHASCEINNDVSYEAPNLYMHDSNCQRNLPTPSGANDPKCMPLEFYKLENIVLRGYVRSNGRTVALAETPDGITWPIALGDYLGKDYGKVISVSTTGLAIRELVKNPYGYIYEQIIHVDYQNNRRPALKN